MRFADEYQDPTSLYNLRARLYDPATGRFTATDPLEGGPDVCDVASHFNEGEDSDNVQF